MRTRSILVREAAARRVKVLDIIRGFAERGESFNGVVLASVMNVTLDTAQEDLRSLRKKGDIEVDNNKSMGPRYRVSGETWTPHCSTRVIVSPEERERRVMQIIREYASIDESERQAPPSQRDIASAAKIAMTTLGDTLKKLESEGRIKRETVTDPANRVRYRFPDGAETLLTDGWQAEDGIEAYREISADASEFLDRLIDVYTRPIETGGPPMFPPMRAYTDDPRL